MQVQLTLSDESPGTSTDSMHRDDAAGADQSRRFNTNMQIRVQLQDSMGGTFQETYPDPEGKVRMTVCKYGTYRLRVTGSTIEETVVDDLQPGRGDKIVNVSLHRKLSKEDAKARKSTVSAQRLRVPKKAQKQLNKGDAALKEGNLETARKCYVNALGIYPQFEEAENNLGIVLMREGKKVEGKAAFDRAIAINPLYAQAQVNLAKIAFDEKRFQDAFELAQQALKSEPLNPAALFVAAESAFFNHDYGNTISYARTLHSLPHQQFGLVHFLAGKSLEAENQPGAAVAEYQAFLEEDPTDPNATRARELLTLLQISRAGALQDSKH